jgi:hypothetical protein
MLAMLDAENDRRTQRKIQNQVAGFEVECSGMSHCDRAFTIRFGDRAGSAF